MPRGYSLPVGGHTQSIEAVVTDGRPELKRTIAVRDDHALRKLGQELLMTWALGDLSCVASTKSVACVAAGIEFTMGLHCLDLDFFARLIRYPNNPQINAPELKLLAPIPSFESCDRLVKDLLGLSAPYVLPNIRLVRARVGSVWLSILSRLTAAMDKNNSGNREGVAQLRLAFEVVKHEPESVSIGLGRLFDKFSGGDFYLNPRATRDLIHQLTSIIAVLHKNRVAHSDVKPSNFLIASSCGTADGPEYVVADLGECLDGDTLHSTTKTNFPSLGVRTPTVAVDTMDRDEECQPVSEGAVDEDGFGIDEPALATAAGQKCKADNSCIGTTSLNPEEACAITSHDFMARMGTPLDYCNITDFYKVDVYCLGGTKIYLLVGWYPKDHREVASWINGSCAVARELVSRCRAVDDGCGIARGSPGLHHLITKMVDADPRTRFTITEVLAHPFYKSMEQTHGWTGQQIPRLPVTCAEIARASPRDVVSIIRKTLFPALAAKKSGSQ